MSREAALELLAVDGVSYESLGVGVRDALMCLHTAREFNELPEVLEQPLERFAGHLRKAIAVLEEARELMA